MNNYTIKIADIGTIDSFVYTLRNGKKYLIINENLSDLERLAVQEEYEVSLWAYKYSTYKTTMLELNF